MEQINKMRERWKVFSDTVLRFPLTIIMLIAAVISNAVAINAQENDNFIKLLVTFVLGASLYAVFQLLYERFFEKPLTRVILMVITVVLSIVYYTLIRTSGWDIEITTRTAVIMFILLIAFLWVPVIKSRISFNESFMAAYKGFFVAVFFTGVLFLGVNIIIGATNMLIVSVEGKAYAHAANIIFVMFTPIYFLSLIPIYPRKEALVMPIVGRYVDEKKQQESTQEESALKESTLKENTQEVSTQEESTLKESTLKENTQEESTLKESTQEESTQEECTLQEITIKEKLQGEEIARKEIEKREEALVKFTTPGRFLETLISYVIIPLTTVFTIILLLYIVLNITGEFWTDNLMEPILVAYSIIVIIVYLQAGTLNNAFAVYFKKIFPKVLVPVVLFQTISSVLRIGEMGITYGRYYVILFGVFATVAGIIFCVVPVRKNGIIAPILIALSIISIVPPVDAFTVSRVNQTGRLEKVLKRNGKLEGDKIIPNTNITKEDQQIIVTSIQYLNNMDYLEDIKWLSSYHQSSNFEDTFGFYEFEQIDNNYLSVYLNREINSPIPISGYDYMVRLNIYSDIGNIEIESFKKQGKNYSIRLDSSSANNQEVVLEEEGGLELIRFALSDIFNKFSFNNSENSTVSTEEATFIQDNAAATLTMVAESISINEWADGKNNQADVYILVKIK